MKHHIQVWGVWIAQQGRDMSDKVLALLGAGAQNAGDNLVGVRPEGGSIAAVGLAHDDGWADIALR